MVWYSNHFKGDYILLVRKRMQHHMTDTQQYYMKFSLFRENNREIEVYISYFLIRAKKVQRFP